MIKLLILDNTEVVGPGGMSGDQVRIRILSEIWVEGVPPEELEFIVLKNRYTSGRPHLLISTSFGTGFKYLTDTELNSVIERYKTT